MSSLSRRLFLRGAGVTMALTGSSALGAFLTTLANGVPSVVVEPFSAAIGVVLYFELRARAEGYDLAQRVSQLGVPAWEPSHRAT